MLQRYSVCGGRIIQGSDGSIPVEVYVKPDAGEKEHLIADYGMDEHTIISSIDPGETPRIEFEDNHTAIILKYPKNYSAEDNFFFQVKSMGIFAFSDKVVIILDEYVPLFTGKIASNVHTVQDVIMKTLLLAIRHFESHLRVINMCSDELEQARLQNETYKEQISELKRQIDNQKLAGAFLSKGDNAESKKKIDRLIKEIDRCISLMEG